MKEERGPRFGLHCVGRLHCFGSARAQQQEQRGSARDGKERRGEERRGEERRGEERSSLLEGVCGDLSLAQIDEGDVCRRAEAKAVEGV